MSRLWGLRHIRYWWHRHNVYNFARYCASMGLGMGHPNEADLIHLKRIWEGKA